MNRKEMIYQLIMDPQYVPMKFHDLVQVLQVPKQDRPILSEILQELVEEGKVLKTEKGKYLSSEKEGLIPGKFAGSGRGFGFLRPDDEALDDVFIPSSGVNSAMNRDKVLVRITRRGGAESPEGVVVKVLKRMNDTIVGTIDIHKNIVFVIPDDKKMNTDVFISKKGLGKLKKGMKVVAKVTKWPDQEKGAAGKIVEVLGFGSEKGVDVMSIIRSHGIKDRFEPETLEEADQCALREKDKKGRKDLRKLMLITIDGEDAKDLDDAVSLEKTEKGFRLGVHIADVSHYVKENSSLDQEAFRRGTSVYFADRVVPMLPEKLSNGLCSLNPQEDRLAMTVFMEITKLGEVISYEIYKSVIQSKYRMTYQNVTKILEGDKELCKKYKPIVPMLKQMKQLSEILRAKRDKRGSVNFDFPEAKIILDENGKTTDVVLREISVSNHIIEEFMLVCNETVAEHMFWAEIPCVYRIHEKPDPEKVESFQKMIQLMGYHLKGGKTMHSSVFNRMLKAIQGKPEEKVLSTMMLRSFMKAKYSSENLGHFGLAAKYYCHFTSPIRRYPDLVVHRILKESLEGALPDKRIKFLKSFTKEAAANSSETEIIAMEAEREVEDIKKAEYMRRFIGQEMEGVVSSVTSFGIFVEFPNTVEGLVRFADLKDDYYIFDSERLSVTGERTRKTYKIGDKVTVIVDRSDVATGQIDLSFA